MSQLVVTGADAPQFERVIGRRWLRRAVRAVLLALHQSRRRAARRIMRETRHLREEGRSGVIGRLEPK